MRELKHNDTIRPWPHNNMARPQDDRAPRRSKFVAGGFIALLAALFVMALFQAPQITWMVGLVSSAHHAGRCDRSRFSSVGPRPNKIKLDGHSISGPGMSPPTPTVIEVARGRPAPFTSPRRHPAGRQTDDQVGTSLRRVRPESLARQPHPRLPARRHPGAHGRRRDPRGDRQPDHLRQGDRRLGRLRRAVLGADRGRLPDRGRLLGAGRRRHHRRAGRPAPGVRRQRRHRRLRLGGGGRRAGPRHPGHDGRRPRAARADRPSPTCS